MDPAPWSKLGLWIRTPSQNQGFGSGSNGTTKVVDSDPYLLESTWSKPWLRIRIHEQNRYYKSPTSKT